MWKRTEDEPGTPYQPSSPAPPRQAAAEPRGRAVIGESIRIEGDVSGEEDLLVQGQVEGKIDLAKNNVTVGRPGRVKADIHGRSISVEGKVQGNLFADEQVVVRESGEVRGNITAPRVSLEDGAKFKGSIDMEPKARPNSEPKARPDSEPKARPGSEPKARPDSELEGRADPEPKVRPAMPGVPHAAAPPGAADGGGSDEKASSPELARSGSPVPAGVKA